MEKLAKLLKNRMELEGLAVRDVAELTGVSHSTIARAANNETVTVSTLVALCDFLGVPLRSVLDTKETPDEVFEQISRVVAIEPELKSVFTDIAQKINEGKLDKKVLSEIAAFAAFRISQFEKEPITEKQEAKVTASKM